MHLFTLKTISTAIVATGATFATIFGGYSWVDDTFVTKNEMLTMFVELRTHQVDESIARYHDKGLSTLSDSDQHRYNMMLKAADKLEEQRNELLGLTNN